MSKFEIVQTIFDIVLGLLTIFKKKGGKKK